MKTASPNPVSSWLWVNQSSAPPLAAEPVSMLSVLAIAANWAASWSAGRALSLSYVACALALAVTQPGSSDATGFCGSGALSPGVYRMWSTLISSPGPW